MTPTSTAMHTLLHRAQTFLAVVDFGSYTRAADFLGISKAMASLHVKSLEEALSVALLVRNTRSIALTETGREFYDEFKGIVRDVGSAFDNAMHSGNRIAGRLRISTTDRKSTRLNSSHLVISYAVFCLKKKNDTRRKH